MDSQAQSILIQYTKSPQVRFDQAVFETQNHFQNVIKIAAVCSYRKWTEDKLVYSLKRGLQVHTWMSQGKK